MVTQGNNFRVATGDAERAGRAGRRRRRPGDALSPGTAAAAGSGFLPFLPRRLAFERGRGCGRRFRRRRLRQRRRPGSPLRPEESQKQRPVHVHIVREEVVTEPGRDRDWGGGG